MQCCMHVPSLLLVLADAAVVAATLSADKLLGMEVSVALSWGVAGAKDTPCTHAILNPLPLLTLPWQGLCNACNQANVQPNMTRLALHVPSIGRAHGATSLESWVFKDW